VLKAWRQPASTVSAAVVEPWRPVSQIGVAATPPECPASRKGFANLPPAVGEFKQTEHPGRPVLILVGDDGNPGGLAAGVDLDADRLQFAPDAVL
jgi:hypothetical protein